MKTRNFITVFLAAALVSCDKPQPISEEPIKPTPDSSVSTYQENPFTLNIDAKKTDVYIFSKTAKISFDTCIFARHTDYRRLFYHPSESPLLHSQYDTIHNIKMQEGEYRLLIENIFFVAPPLPWDSIQKDDTARWYHIIEVSVVDTIGFSITDTFFRKEFYIGNI